MCLHEACTNTPHNILKHIDHQFKIHPFLARTIMYQHSPLLRSTHHWNTLPGDIAWFIDHAAFVNQFNIFLDIWLTYLCEFVSACMCLFLLFFHCKYIFSLKMIVLLGILQRKNFGLSVSKKAQVRPHPQHPPVLLKFLRSYLYDCQ